jgi:hypothetical protein
MLICPFANRPNRPPADPLAALKLEDEKARKQLESATKARNEAEARLTKVEADYKAEEARVQAAAPSKSSKFELHLGGCHSGDGGLTEEWRGVVGIACYLQTRFFRLRYFRSLCDALLL